MRKGFMRRPKAEEPAANHEKNYIIPGGIERLKATRKKRKRRSASQPPIALAVWEYSIRQKHFII
jgi:hypothetical protein